MQKQPPHNSGRFQDPLGDYMREVSAAHARRMNRLVSVVEVYQAFYARFEPRDKEGMDYLGGVEGIVGSALDLRTLEDGPGFVARDGRRVALLEGEPAEKLDALLERGWVIHCVLANTRYSAETKSFAGEFACIAYDPQLDEKAKGALEAFVEHTVDRIAHATRPGLALTQEQFTRVVESGGAWYLTKDEPWPELPRGSVFYRRRRTLSDRLVSMAIKGNKGCLVASWVATALVVAAILWAIWAVFLAGR
jgi:hypothetical protein